MKKYWKIIVLILIVITGYLSWNLFLNYRDPAAPDQYWNKQITGGEIEEKYSQLGSYEVVRKEYEGGLEGSNQRHQLVYHPKEEGVYPLVILVNGTLAPYQQYEQVFYHLASWGFVVVGDDYDFTWNGKSASQSLDFALNTPEIAQMVDSDNIAIGGHSQGGLGAINALVEYDNGSMYKTIFALSPVSKPLAMSLLWIHMDGEDGPYAYDLSKIDIPMLMLASTGNSDSIVSYVDEMYKNFDEINSTVVMARRKYIDHGEVLWQADGYVTAWLMYQLKDDQYAGKAFFGENAELAHNEYWQDYKEKESE